MVLLRERVARRGIGAIEPCLPSPAKAPPSGPGWLHEIKHDGFRLIVRRDAAGVRLITRKGNDLTYRFPFIALAVAKLPVRSCLIDGEAIVCDDNGLAVFELIRRQRTSATAVHCAFDLLELDGEDLRRVPIERRKAHLAKLLRGAPPTIVLNEHYGADGAIIYRHACKLGCEGIVSKRLGSPYRSGRTAHAVVVTEPSGDEAGVQAIRRNASTMQAPRELTGEKDIGELRAFIGHQSTVVPGALQIVKVEDRPAMCLGCHVDHARRC
jgi:hypothetical protein